MQLLKGATIGQASIHFDMSWIKMQLRNTKWTFLLDGKSEITEDQLRRDAIMSTSRVLNLQTG